LIGNPSQISLPVKGLIVTARGFLENCFNPGMDELEEKIEAKLEKESDFKVSPLGLFSTLRRFAKVYRQLFSWDNLVALHSNGKSLV